MTPAAVLATLQAAKSVVKWTYRFLRLNFKTKNYDPPYPPRHESDPEAMRQVEYGEQPGRGMSNVGDKDGAS